VCYIQNMKTLKKYEHIQHVCNKVQQRAKWIQMASTWNHKWWFNAPKVVYKTRWSHLLQNAFCFFVKNILQLSPVQKAIGKSWFVRPKPPLFRRGNFKAYAKPVFSPSCHFLHTLELLKCNLLYNQGLHFRKGEQSDTQGVSALSHTLHSFAISLYIHIIYEDSMLMIQLILYLWHFWHRSVSVKSVPKLCQVAKSWSRRVIDFLQFALHCTFARELGKMINYPKNLTLPHFRYEYFTKREKHDFTIPPRRSSRVHRCS